MRDVTGHAPQNTPGMETSTTAFAPLRLAVHLLVAVSVSIVTPFTAMAWPFAIGVGMILGSADAARIRGERTGLGDSVATGMLAGIGVLAMLFFGAFVGGIVAIVVVALVVFSERAAAHASPVDRGIARILLFVIPLAMWLFVLPLLGFDIDITIGG